MYRVWLRSVPGFYEQYSGKVDVNAEDAEDAADKAMDKLSRTAFQDRNASMWIVEKVERIR